MTFYYVSDSKTIFIRHVNITQSTHGIFIDDDLNCNVTLEDLSISYSNYGLRCGSYWYKTVNLTVKNAVLLANTYGIDCSSNIQSFTLISSHIESMSEHTLRIGIRADGLCKIKHNTFKSNKGCINFGISTNAQIRFENNSIIDHDSEGASCDEYIIQIEFSSGSNGSINNNTFIKTKTNAALTISGKPNNLLLTRNNFIDNEHTSGATAVKFSLNPEIYDERFDRVIHVSTDIKMASNYYKDNNGLSTVHFGYSRYSNRGPFNITMSSDNFVNCLTTHAAIETDIPYLKIHQTVLHNIAHSLRDLRLTYSENISLNCSHNWWGSPNLIDIKKRIHDLYPVNNEPRVIIEPIQTSPNIGCPSENECSNQGTCVRPNYCECNPGWTGSDCSKVSCSQLNDCYNRGTCVSPNVCQCNTGWLPPNCQEALCDQVNDCNGRGICTEPNK